MDVSIKDLTVNMEVKANGIEFEVRQPNNGSFVGDCYLTMTGIIWCHGKTTRANGIKMSWDELMTILNSKETLKAAVKAAKQT